MRIIERERKPAPDAATDICGREGIGGCAGRLRGKDADDAAERVGSDAQRTHAAQSTVARAADTESVDAVRGARLRGKRRMRREEGPSQKELAAIAGVEIGVRGDPVDRNRHLRDRAVEEEGDGRAARCRASGHRKRQGSRPVVDSREKPVGNVRAEHAVDLHALGNSESAADRQHDEVLAADRRVSDLNRVHVRELPGLGMCADAGEVDAAGTLLVQGRGNLGRDDVRAAGVEDERVRSFAVEHHVKVNVIVDDVNGNGRRRAACDGKVMRVRLRHAQHRRYLGHVDCDR